MSIPTPERSAALALKIAGASYLGGCVDCGATGYELHEIIKRTMRPILGSTVCILGVTLVPLCQECHFKWAKKTMEEQIRDLQHIMQCNFALRRAQSSQILALRSQALKA